MAKRVRFCMVHQRSTGLGYMKSCKDTVNFQDYPFFTFPRKNPETENSGFFREKSKNKQIRQKLKTLNFSGKSPKINEFTKTELLKLKAKFVYFRRFDEIFHRFLFASCPQRPEKTHRRMAACLILKVKNRKYRLDSITIHSFISQ